MTYGSNLFAMYYAQSLGARAYIQDGLIAMWDGIENTGWGMHDGGATIWKDLTGNGYDITIPDVIDVLDNGMLRKDTTGYETMIVPMTFSRPFSMEMRVTCPAALGTGSLALMCIGTISAAIKNVPCLVVKAGRYFEWGYDFNYGTVVFEPNKRLTLASTVTQEATNCVGYVDSQLCSASNGDGWGFYQNQLGILGDNRQNKYAAMGYTANSVRIYNRALTAEEIAHNYVVDKARFNIQ